MNINFVATTPLDFTLTLPEEPTPEQVSINRILKAIGVEWTLAGQTTTHKLWCVISRTNDLVGLKAVIAQYKLPIKILMAQNAHKTIKAGAKDADGNPVHELVVHEKTTKAALLKFMSDEVTYDMETGKELSRKPATKVTLPMWGGHEGFVV